MAQTAIDHHTACEEEEAKTIPADDRPCHLRNQEYTALIRSIGEDLEDDTRRLATADWLEECNCETRAEFIRLQCEIAKIRSFGGKPDEALLAREQELLKAYGGQWRAEVPAGIASLETHGGDIPVFERGFLSLRAPSIFELLEGNNARVLDAVPIDQLFINDVPRQMLRGYNGPADVLDETMFDQLLTRPWLRQITDLHIAASVDDSYACRLAQCPYLENLKKLSLDIGGITHNGDYAEAIADSPFLQKLTDLRLDFRNVIGGNPIGRQLGELLQPGKLPDLRRISIHQGSINNQALVVLAAQPGLAKIQELHLSGQLFTARGLHALVHSPYTANLRGLTLDPVDARGLMTILSSPAFPKLKLMELRPPYDGSRSLGDTGYPDRVLKAFGTTPFFNSVKQLCYNDHIISPATITAMVNAWHKAGKRVCWSQLETIGWNESLEVYCKNHRVKLPEGFDFKDYPPRIIEPKELKELQRKWQKEYGVIEKS